MNLATKLTVARVIGIPLFITAFMWQAPSSDLAGDWGKVVATVIFIFAAITDYYDGYLARRYNMITTFGKFIDPIADKLLVSAALVVMVAYSNVCYMTTAVASWISVIIIAREFAVTGLRLICAEKGEVISASKAGKFKTASQLTAIITCLVLISARVIMETNGTTSVTVATYNSYCYYIINTLMAISAIATLYSGYDYFRKNKHFLAK